MLTKHLRSPYSVLLFALSIVQEMTILSQKLHQAEAALDSHKSLLADYEEELRESRQKLLGFPQLESDYQEMKVSEFVSVLWRL